MIGFVVVGVAFGDALCLVAGEFQLQFLGDGSSDLTLRRKQFRHFALVLFAPERLIVTAIYQFDCDVQIIAPLNKTARHHCINTKFAGDLSYVRILAFISNDRTCRTDLQTRQL